MLKWQAHTIPLNQKYVEKRETKGKLDFLDRKPLLQMSNYEGDSNINKVDNGKEIRI